MRLKDSFITFRVISVHRRSCPSTSNSALVSVSRHTRAVRSSLCSDLIGVAAAERCKTQLRPHNNDRLAEVYVLVAALYYLVVATTGAAP